MEVSQCRCHRLCPLLITATHSPLLSKNCAVGTGNCSTTESHPGLWEFPLWDVQGVDGSDIASMDPVGNWTELYMQEFGRNYGGNRAPLGIYMHAGSGLMAFPDHAEEVLLRAGDMGAAAFGQTAQGQSCAGGNVVQTGHGRHTRQMGGQAAAAPAAPTSTALKQLNNFLDWALTHDNVWLATVSQVRQGGHGAICRACHSCCCCGSQAPTPSLLRKVLSWMKDPVPASQYQQPCPTPTDMWFATGHFCAEPVGGCIQVRQVDKCSLPCWDDVRLQEMCGRLPKLLIFCIAPQGTWDSDRCACDCLKMYNASSPGFCPDATGACTLAKPYINATAGFRCPGASVAPPPVMLHPQATPDVGHAPLPLAGLALSASARPGAAGDGASLFAEAFNAVDNLTSTCVVAAPSTPIGSTYLTLYLPTFWELNSVVLLLGSAASSLQLLAGNDSRDGG